MDRGVTSPGVDAPIDVKRLFVLDPSGLNFRRAMN
jgi:hypothetical protein